MFENMHLAHGWTTALKRAMSNLNVTYVSKHVPNGRRANVPYPCTNHVWKRCRQQCHIQSAQYAKCRLTSTRPMSKSTIRHPQRFICLRFG